MTKKKSKAGRISIFRGKSDGSRVQGIITKIGSGKFERARVALAELYEAVVGHQPASVSDADVIEYLARGGPETRRYLELHVRS